MTDFETEYIALRNTLIEKYGEPTFKNAAAKSVALFCLSENFKRIASNASFQEEVSTLIDRNLFLKVPEVKGNYNELQTNFRENRYSEIVKEDIDGKSFNQFSNKRNAAEALGIATISKGMLNGKLPSGHSLDEVADDLYKLYTVQYNLYKQNPNHPIFINAILENTSHLKRGNEQVREMKDKSGGCFGVILFIILIITLAATL